ncbi:putative leader peptide [Modestobacter sp. SYSU DS0290]
MPQASGDPLPSAAVGTLLTSRRTVDLCRVGSCLCPAC